MSDIHPRHVTLPTANGKIEVVLYRAADCRRYVGKFMNPNLQARADTGLWYTTVQGNPFVKTGEGTTPQYAISDAISRSEELAKKLQQGVQTLKGVLDGVEWA